MNIQLILVPYDSGRKCARTGCGPDYLLQGGIEKILKDGGHQVNVVRIESQRAFDTENGTAFELNRLLAAHLESVAGKDIFPVVLAGNCNSCVGAVAGIGPDKTGIIWFDAHGDFNTPDTTLSGFLDGMGMAMLAGRCWKSVLKTIPGYKPVPEANFVHVGAIDLDYDEEKMLKEAGIPVLRLEPGGEAGFLGAFRQALDDLEKSVESVYLHIDMDVLDADRAKANHFALPGGGLSVEMVEDCIKIIKKLFKIRACGIASFDPAYDRDGMVLQAGIRFLKVLSDD